MEFSLCGEFRVDEFDTMKGEIRPLPVKYENGFTTAEKRMDADDSLLLRFTPGRSEIAGKSENLHGPIRVEIPDRVEYELTEPNALLLDMAKISLDGSTFEIPESESKPLYLLEASKAVREKCGYPNDRLQPYKRPDLLPEHLVTLDFTIESEIETEATLAIELVDGTKIHLNGVKVDPVVYGFFADKAISRIKLPRLKSGENHIRVTIPFGLKTTLEPMYLLGNFGVRGGKITNLPETLTFSDLTSQGLGFYTGDLIYKIPTPKGRVRLKLAEVPAAVYAEVDKIPVCFAPFEADFESDGTARLMISPGRHNIFGALHNKRDTCGSPETFYPNVDDFTETPLPRPRGIIGKPELYRW